MITVAPSTADVRQAGRKVFAKPTQMYMSLCEKIKQRCFLSVLTNRSAQTIRCG